VFLNFFFECDGVGRAWFFAFLPGLVCSSAYPLGLVYDPNMIWKTEPAPQPTENLIQEQACALKTIEIFHRWVESNINI
jgi:hypothetical protein